MSGIPDKSIFLPGNATGILLVHGLGGTPVELKSVAKGMNAAGYTVLCCQLAGHCGSDEDLKNSRLEQWVASVEAGLARLRETCGIVLAGGLSMGALMALNLAHSKPDEVQGLLLFAPTLRHDGWAIPWYSFLLDVLIDTPIGTRWQFVESHPYGLKDERVRNIVLRAMRSGNSAEGGIEGTPSQSVKQFWQLIKRVKALLPQVKTPAFIVHAREDDISSLKRNTFVLQSRLGGLVETLVLDDSYHIVTLDRQRDILIERAVAYVAWIAEHSQKQRAMSRLSASRIAEA